MDELNKETELRFYKSSDAEIIIGLYYPDDSCERFSIIWTKPDPTKDFVMPKIEILDNWSILCENPLVNYLLEKLGYLNLVTSVPPTIDRVYELLLFHGFTERK